MAAKVTVLVSARKVVMDADERDCSEVRGENSRCSLENQPAHDFLVTSNTQPVGVLYNITHPA